MEVTEVGYYWYRHNGSLNQVVVQVTNDLSMRGLVVWFFGSEHEMSLPQAEKRGTFLKKIEY